MLDEVRFNFIRNRSKRC